MVRRSIRQRKATRSRRGAAKTRQLKARRSRVKLARFRRTIPRMSHAMYNALVRPKLATRLTYVDTKTITPSTGAASHTFKLNDLFDPDFTGLGHQPAFRDQWNGLYSTYRVTGCTWTISFEFTRQPIVPSAAIIGLGSNALEAGLHWDESSSNMHNCSGLVAYEVNDKTTRDDTNTSDQNMLRESGNAKKNVRWKYIHGPYGRAKLVGSTSMRAILDDPVKANASQSLGAVATHPVYLHIAAMSKDGTPMAPVRFDVKLQYSAVLTDPGNINES